jgi:hypothetical protein
MASQLATAHIIAQEKVRQTTVKGVGTIWQGLSGYDEGNMTEWLRQVVPYVIGGQRASVAITAAYLARVLEVPAPGINAGQLIKDLRGGVTMKEVYRRPFVTVWGMLGEHRPWQDAHNAGMVRARAAAAVDVQMAMRATCQLVQEMYA